LARGFLLPLAAFSDRLGNRFYVALAAVVMLVAWAAIATDRTAGMKDHAYDLVMKYRFRAPAPDADIVVLDIDEVALAAMFDLQMSMPARRVRRQDRDYRFHAVVGVSRGVVSDAESFHGVRRSHRAVCLQSSLLDGRTVQPHGRRLSS
jgi:hypothetical protein